MICEPHIFPMCWLSAWRCCPDDVSSANALTLTKTEVQRVGLYISDKSALDNSGEFGTAEFRTALSGRCAVFLSVSVP
jgi:hypothetical protein